MTLIQAQQRYIDRVNSCHPGHRNRVSRSAWAQLYKFAIKQGAEKELAGRICQDARDMANLERMAGD